LLARRPAKVAAIALANKIARMAVGDDGQGRALQGTRRARGVNEIGIDREQGIGKAGNRRVNAKVARLIVPQ
jgi:hypothetical protein